MAEQLVARFVAVPVPQNLFRIVEVVGLVQHGQISEKICEQSVEVPASCRAVCRTCRSCRASALARSLAEVEVTCILFRIRLLPFSVQQLLEYNKLEMFLEG